MPYSSDAKKLLMFAGININSRSSTSPISLSRIGRKLGLRYSKMPLHHNTGGMLVRSHKGPYVVINENHPYTRRRFSSAHEIGHFILGHDSDVSVTQDNRWEEVQANRYASCLLMPDELFYYVHKEQRSIKEMAAWLRVSPVSVAIRCMQFGIRSMEAELVRSDYYQTLDEIAISFDDIEENIAPTELMPPSKPAITRTRPIDPELRKRNESMLDRWRQMYGYE